jgi:8-oxo-dGTP diphosphatase
MGPIPLCARDLDWIAWQPRERATLVFVVEGGNVLLIHKKRGLGSGKINGPGGRLEPGETAEACARRELEEELHVSPVGLVAQGELLFQFVDGYGLHCVVFRAAGCLGVPVETDEAKPFYSPVGSIPYEKMWADDALWLPLLLAGERFRGRFVFDRDTMLDHEVERLGPLGNFRGEESVLGSILR